MATHVVRSVAFQAWTPLQRAPSPRVALRHRREIRTRRALLDLRHRLEIGARHIIGLEREAELRQPIERAGEVVDGVVGNGQRTVSALVAHLEAVVDDVLLAHLDVVRELRAVDRLAPAAFVQANSASIELALVLQQPLDAVVRAAAFLVGGERDDDVAVGLEAFALVANEIRDPDGRLRLVVARAAAVEVAVLLVET